MIAPPREQELLRVPPGDRIVRLAYYARMYRSALDRPDISAEQRARHEEGLHTLAELAQATGVRVPMLNASSISSS